MWAGVGYTYMPLLQKQTAIASFSSVATATAAAKPTSATVVGYGRTPVRSITTASTS